MERQFTNENSRGGYITNKNKPNINIPNQNAISENEQFQNILQNEKDLILQIISESNIHIDSTKLKSDWEEFTMEDQKFYKKNKLVINMIQEKILKVVSDIWVIVGLIKLFLKLSFITEEVFNTLFMINNTLQHLDYFEKLYDNNNKHSNYNASNRNFNKTREIDEYLTESYFQMNIKFFFVLNNYKTKYSEIGLDSSYDDENQEIYYKDFSDRRREIFLDKKGYFNYINVKCSYKSHDINDDSCPYSHNQIEISYHPFNLKTRLCRDKEHCSKEYCGNSHSLNEDFRYIYNPKQGIFKKLSFLFEKYDLFTDSANIPHLKSFNQNLNMGDHQNLPSEFHPHLYKTKECPLGSGCKLDSKLCLNYHNIFERRRDPTKFEYSAKSCTMVYFENKWKSPLNCKNRDSCNFSHNIYEYLYNKEIFRRKQCVYENQGMNCEYLVICPYYHKEDIRDNLSGICYNKRTVNFYVENIREKISEESEKIKLLQSIIDQHKCPVCKKEYECNYIKLSCGDVICLDCSDNIKNANQKVCLICTKEIKNMLEIKLKKI